MFTIMSGIVTFARDLIRDRVKSELPVARA
jgi:hypothetical protein